MRSSRNLAVGKGEQMSAPVIAVFDGEPGFLLLVHALLSDEGYEVCLWCDHDHVRAMIHHTLPDLVILALWLDVWERGWAVLHALRSDPTTGAIPIIVCTSGGVPSTAQASTLREHHCTVVQDPCDPGELLTLIETVLDNATGLLPRMPSGHFAFPLTLDG